MKGILVGLAFVGIIGSLASALVFMMRRDDPSGRDDPRRAGRMVKALALRVGLSVLLFICVLVAWKLGYIQPSGLPTGG
ncbi:MAG: twin transmembrane helix small protein [Ottowia sp.]|uniref:twin transmembrane helix small protein n=1 Tax=Ottowia sp. TaxID=1898956 RepID=UPI0039E66D42